MKNTFKPRPHIITPVMEERIVNVAYGEGSVMDRIVVHFTRRANPKVGALLRAHRETVEHTRLHGAGIRCPEPLEKRLLEIAAPSRKPAAPFARLMDFARSSQAITAVMAVAVAALILWSDREPGPSEMELNEATLQAKASLALISEIMTGTTQEAYQSAMIDETAVPLRQTISKGTQTIKNNL